MNNKQSGYPGGLVAGAGILTVGLIFLFDNLEIIDVAVLWPLIPISIGAAMIVHHYLHK